MLPVSMTFSNKFSCRKKTRKPLLVIFKMFTLMACLRFRHMLYALSNNHFSSHGMFFFPHNTALTSQNIPQINQFSPVQVNCRTSSILLSGTHVTQYFCPHCENALKSRQALTRSAPHIEGIFGQSGSGRWRSDLVCVHCVHVQLHDILPLDDCKTSEWKVVYARRNVYGE